MDPLVIAGSLIGGAGLLGIATTAFQVVFTPGRLGLRTTRPTPPNPGFHLRVIAGRPRRAKARIAEGERKAA
ncbi:MAG: hypothetical protein ACRDJ4_15615 [Actinomycetota bacterium]